MCSDRPQTGVIRGDGAEGTDYRPRTGPFQLQLTYVELSASLAGKKKRNYRRIRYVHIREGLYVESEKSV